MGPWRMEASPPTLACNGGRKALPGRMEAMNKLILLAAALLVAGQASAYAQGDHATRHRTGT